jgi:hypothetical protein
MLHDFAPLLPSHPSLENNQMSHYVTQFTC